MLFYKVSIAEILKMRNNIVLQTVVPALERNGFVKAPFSSSNFGYVNSDIYIYQMCRLVDNKYLESVSVDIARRDKYIKVFINAFELSPSVNDMSLLSNVDGVNFSLPANSKKRMHLVLDFIQVPPIMSWDFWFNDFKLKSYWTRKGYQKRVCQLTALLKTRTENIDSFFKKWYQLNQPNITAWNGEIIEQR